MPKFMAIHVAILAGLVLAVTFLIFQSRALTFRLQALESATPKEGPAPSTPARAAPAEGSDAPDELKPVQVEGSSKPAVRPVTPPTSSDSPADARAPEASLTSAQEQAVERSVDRILKEKYGHLPRMPNPDDLEKTLAKELNLTESQKARIGELVKKKRQELRELFENEPAAGLPLKKGMEIDRKYDALIKNELDAAQQAKYEQLKKDGKIPQGVTIQIEAGGPDTKEP